MATTGLLLTLPPINMQGPLVRLVTSNNTIRQGQYTTAIVAASATCQIHTLTSDSVVMAALKILSEYLVGHFFGDSRSSMVRPRALLCTPHSRMIISKSLFLSLPPLFPSPQCTLTFASLVLMTHYNHKCEFPTSL